MNSLSTKFSKKSRITKLMKESYERSGIYFLKDMYQRNWFTIEVIAS